VKGNKAITIRRSNKGQKSTPATQLNKNYYHLKYLKSIFIIIIVLLTLFASCTNSQNTPTGNSEQQLPALIPYRVDDNWGYCDKDKKIIIQPSYKEAYFFSEGLAPVKINGKFGFIDENGQVVIKPFYYGASNFNNGLAWVKFYSVDQKAYKCGFINKKVRLL